MLMDEIQILNLLSYECEYKTNRRGKTNNVSLEKLFLDTDDYYDFGLDIDVTEKNMKRYKNEDMNLFYYKRLRLNLYYFEINNKKFVAVFDPELLKRENLYIILGFYAQETNSYNEKSLDECLMYFQDVLGIQCPFVINVYNLTYEEKRDIYNLIYFLYQYYTNPERLKKIVEKHREEHKRFLEETKNKVLKVFYEYNPRTGENEMVSKWVYDDEYEATQDNESDDENEYEWEVCCNNEPIDDDDCPF